MTVTLDSFGVNIGDDVGTDDDTGGWGPDRSLSLSDTADVRLAPGPEGLPEFVLNRDGSVPTWERASERFLQRLQADSPHDARFTGPWATRTRARLLRADERMREWCRATVLLTFTGSPFLTDDGPPMAPTAFMQGLTATLSARRRALRDVLEQAGGRWLTIRVVGAHRSGYPHEHVLVGTETRLSDHDFEPVIGAHRDGPVAGDGAHGVGAVCVESDPRTEDVTGGTKYVAPDVPGVRSVLEADGSDRTPNGVVGESTHRVRTATVLEATGTQAVRIDSSEGVNVDWY